MTNRQKCTFCVMLDDGVDVVVVGGVHFPSVTLCYNCHNVYVVVYTTDWNDVRSNKMKCNNLAASPKTHIKMMSEMEMAGSLHTKRNDFRSEKIRWAFCFCRPFIPNGDHFASWTAMNATDWLIEWSERVGKYKFMQNSLLWPSACVWRSVDKVLQCVVQPKWNWKINRGYLCWT